MATSGKQNTKKSTIRAKAISYVTDTEPSPAELLLESLLQGTGPLKFAEHLDSRK